jgi:hypothetical protein
MRYFDSIVEKEEEREAAGGLAYIPSESEVKESCS